MGASELGDLAGRAANTATNVEDLHTLLHVHGVGEVVLVAGDSLVERLALGEAAEVERLAPAILVDVGGKVIVTSQLMLEARRDRKRTLIIGLLTVSSK